MGSNLGDRLKNLQAARDLLEELAVAGSLLQAPIYQTEPVACPPGSPDFYNTVVAFDYIGTASELLAATQSIEARLGREVVPQRNAPRVIDVDILFLGEEWIESDTLILPHPRLTVRRFVLQPLADILPGLILPASEVSIAEHLRQLDSDEPPLAIVRTTW